MVGLVIARIQKVSIRHITNIENRKQPAKTLCSFITESIEKVHTMSLFNLSRIVLYNLYTYR